MFIKDKILIRLMKAAYKGTGVYMGRHDGWYTLGGSYWQARIAVGCVPNTVAAAMVELSGMIPGDGEGWTVDKESMQLAAVDPWEGLSGEYTHAYVRRICFVSPGGSALRVIQREDNEALTYPEALVAAAIVGDIDKDNDETPRTGPLCAPGGHMYWQTNQAEWHIRPIWYQELRDMQDFLSSQALELAEVGK